MLACGVGSFLSVFAMQESEVINRIGDDTKELHTLLTQTFDALCKDDRPAANKTMKEASACWNRMQTVLLSSYRYSMPMDNACKQISSMFVLKDSMPLKVSIKEVLQLRESIKLFLCNVQNNVGENPKLVLVKKDDFKPKTFKELYEEKCKEVVTKNKGERDKRILKFKEERTKEIHKKKDVIEKKIDEFLNEITVSDEHKEEIRKLVKEKLILLQEEVEDFYGPIKLPHPGEGDKKLKSLLQKDFDEKYKQLLKADGLELDFYGSFYFPKDALPAVNEGNDNCRLNIQEAASHFNILEQKIKNLRDFKNQEQEKHLISLLGVAMESLEKCHDCLAQLNPGTGNWLLTKIGYLKADVLSECKARARFEAHYNRLLAIEKLLFGSEKVISDSMLEFFSPEKMFDVFVELRDSERKTIAHNLRKKWQDEWLSKKDKLKGDQEYIDGWEKNLGKINCPAFAGEYAYLKHAQQQAQNHFDKCKVIANKYNNPNFLTGFFTEGAYLEDQERFNIACARGNFKDLSEYDQKIFADEYEQMNKWLAYRDEKLLLVDLLGECDKEHRVSLLEFVERFNLKPNRLQELKATLKKGVDMFFENEKLGSLIPRAVGLVSLCRESTLVSQALKKGWFCSWLGSLVLPQYPAGFELFINGGLTLDQALDLINAIINSTEVGKVLFRIGAQNLVTCPDTLKKYCYMCIDAIGAGVNTLENLQLADLLKELANKNIISPLLQKTTKFLTTVNETSTDLHTNCETVVPNIKKTANTVIEVTNHLPNVVVWGPGMGLQSVHESKALGWAAWLASFNLPYDVIAKISPEMGTRLKAVVDYGLTPEQALKLIRVVIDSNSIGKALFEIFEQKMRQKPEVIKGYFTAIISLMETLATGTLGGADKVALLLKNKIEEYEPFMDTLKWTFSVGSFSPKIRQKFAEELAQKFITQVPQPYKKTNPEKRPIPEEINADALKYKLDVASLINKADQEANALKNASSNQNVSEEIYEKHYTHCFSTQCMQVADKLKKEELLLQQSIDQIKNPLDPMTKKQEEGLKQVRETRATLANSMRWYKYLWLPGVLAYWKKDSELERLEQRWAWNLASETQSILEKIREQRRELNMPMIDKLYRLVESAGNSTVRFLKDQVSFDYFSTLIQGKSLAEKEKVEKKESPAIKEFSLRWYHCLWLPNVFAKVQDAALKKDESKFSKRIIEFNTRASYAKDQVEIQKELLQQKMLALKLSQKRWREYATSLQNSQKTLLL